MNVIAQQAVSIEDPPLFLHVQQHMNLIAQQAGTMKDPPPPLFLHVQVIHSAIHI